MLDALFKPRAVAVIGASTKELHIGNRVIKNLLDFGFHGPIYPINPNAPEIRGVQAYASILDVPTEVDVVHMVIPAKYVPLAIDDCGKKGVKFVILNGGGFAEVGPEGAAIQEDCLARARQHGIRIFGPNCQGIINTDPAVRAYCNFTFTRPEVGHISIVALSGGVAELIHQAFAEMGVGTRLYASNGNACDVSIPEVLAYYGDDPGTRVIVLYVEGLRESAAFLEVAQAVAAKKPILAMKAGRTAEGARAAASHTGGLARVDMATDLIFEKAGILSFRDERELCEAAAVFASQPVPRGNRVGVITNTGGPAVIAMDVLAGAGVELPPLPERAKEALQGRLYPEASIRNPIDVLATAGGQHFRAALDVMMEEDQFDSLFVNFVTPFFVDTESIAREIAAVSQARIKPMVCNLMTDKQQWAETLRILREGGVPCFSCPSTAARALAALVRYQQLRARETGAVRVLGDVDAGRAAAVVQRAREARRTQLAAAEAYEVLAAYGIGVAGWRVVGSAAEAERAAAELGFPVVVKAEAASLVHKSDVGGVAVNLGDSAAVHAAVEAMQARLDAPDLRFLVQQYLPGGTEVIVGAKSEGEAGHLVMFGLGGILVEILRDVVFKLTPVTPAEAREMLSSIQGAPLLRGARGRPGVDQEGLADLILRVSQLVVDLPAIQEMDLNPIIAYEDRVVVVDARIGVQGG